MAWFAKFGIFFILAILTPIILFTTRCVFNTKLYKDIFSQYLIDDEETKGDEVLVDMDNPRGQKKSNSIIRHSHNVENCKAFVATTKERLLVAVFNLYGTFNECYVMNLQDLQDLKVKKVIGGMRISFVGNTQFGKIPMKMHVANRQLLTDLKHQKEHLLLLVEHLIKAKNELVLQKSEFDNTERSFDDSSYVSLAYKPWKTVEVNSEKYICVDEDIDTILVKTTDNHEFENGFTILKKEEDWQYGETINCKLVKKTDVDSCYYDWEDKKSYFGSMEVSCKETDGGIRVELLKEPQEYKEEFKYEEYIIDRGTEFPPHETIRYYAIVDADDKRLKRDIITHYHKDYEIKKYGIYEGMSEQEYVTATVNYLIEKVGNDRGNFGFELARNLYSLFIGNYGYRIKNKFISTDIDLIFEKVITEAYSIYKCRESHGEKEFCKNLEWAIIHEYGMRRKEDELFIENGERIYASNEYKYYMYLRFHLKLMEMHKAGIEPYSILKFKGIMYWLKNEYSRYKDNHNQVLWRNNLICNDLGEFAKWAMNELQYFKMLDY